MSCKKGLNWTEKETRTFLELCIDKQILAIMDGKKHKHIEIFRILVPLMEETGYPKTAEQMKLKLKNLKLAYFKCKRDNNVSGAATTRCPFYNELEILYGCRPSAEAVSNVGLDTASLENNEELNSNDTDNTTQEDNASYDMLDEIVNTSDEENKEPAAKKAKTKRVGGRKSYETVLDNYTDKWFQSQKGVLDTIIEQDKMQKELIQQEMEKQREWEEREMEKERDFQREQTNQIMQTFVQTIHMLRPQMPFFQQNTYKPFKLIPMRENTGASSSTVKKNVDNSTSPNQESLQ